MKRESRLLLQVEWACWAQVPFSKKGSLCGLRKKYRNWWSNGRQSRGFLGPTLWSLADLVLTFSHDWEHIISIHYHSPWTGLSYLVLTQSVDHQIWKPTFTTKHQEESLQTLFMKSNLTHNLRHKSWCWGKKNDKLEESGVTQASLTGRCLLTCL